MLNVYKQTISLFTKFPAVTTVILVLNSLPTEEIGSLFSKYWKTAFEKQKKNLQNIIKSWNKTREYKKLRGKYTTKESTNLPNTSPTYLPTKLITQNPPKSPNKLQTYSLTERSNKKIIFFSKGSTWSKYKTRNSCAGERYLSSCFTQLVKGESCNYITSLKRRPDKSEDDHDLTYFESLEVDITVNAGSNMYKYLYYRR